MKAKQLTLLLLLFSSSLQLLGQQKLILDLASARQHALDHNKAMINSAYNVDKAQLALREAIANGLPQVNASMDYSNALGAKISIRFNENMPVTEIDIKPQSNFYLNVGQLIFSASYIVGIQTAKLYRDLSLLGQKKTEIEIITQVSEAYYLVLISAQLRNILQQNLLNLEELYNKTEVLEHAGVIEKTDLDQLWVQLNTLQNAVTASERQFELATNMLRLHLGATVDTEIELTDKLNDLIEVAGFENSEFQQFKVDQHIDFRMMQQQKAIGKKKIDMRRATMLPTLSAFYRHTHKLIKPDFDMAPNNMVGLQLNIPVFSSGVRRAQIKQAAIDLKTTQNNIELLSDRLKIQENQLRFNFNNAFETYNNQKRNVEVSRRVYKNLKLKYKQGLISGLDLINADNNYLRVETDYISAMMQVLNSRLQLEKLHVTML